MSSDNLQQHAEKEKELQTIVSTCDTIIHRIEYATIYWSCSFGRIEY